MSREAPRLNLVHRRRVTSTMELLDELTAGGAPEWTVALADEQTAGLGRAGRAWDAEQGSALLCSVLVRPRPTSLVGGMLAIGAGVAVAELLAGLGVAAQLKWPNDILLEGRKLGGILIRSRRDASGVAINVGIGLNLTRPREDEAPVRAAVADLVSSPPTARELLPTLLAQLDQNLHARDAPSVRDVWSSYAAYLGEAVGVLVDGVPVQGQMRGIDGDGALLVEASDGSLGRIVAGDLVRGPRPRPDRSAPILTR